MKPKHCSCHPTQQREATHRLRSGYLLCDDGAARREARAAFAYRRALPQPLGDTK